MYHSPFSCKAIPRASEFRSPSYRHAIAVCNARLGHPQQKSLRAEGGGLLPGQDDLHHVPLLLDGPAQRGDHVAQAAHLADGRHLHRHMHHMQPRGLQLQHRSSQGSGPSVSAKPVLSS